MKKSVGGWAYMLSKKYGISYDTVRSIVTLYLKYCVDQVCNGHRVVLIGLASILPKDEEVIYFSTPAFDCREISRRNNLAPETVWGIVQGYLSYAREDILAGEDVTFRGLCTLSIQRDIDTKEIKNVYANISRTLVDKLELKDMSARVKLNPKLRRDLQSKQVVA